MSRWVQSGHCARGDPWVAGPLPREWSELWLQKGRAQPWPRSGKLKPVSHRRIPATNRFLPTPGMAATGHLKRRLADAGKRRRGERTQSHGPGRCNEIATAKLHNDTRVAVDSFVSPGPSRPESRSTMTTTPSQPESPTYAKPRDEAARNGLSAPRVAPPHARNRARPPPGRSMTSPAPA